LFSCSTPYLRFRSPRLNPDLRNVVTFLFFFAFPPFLLCPFSPSSSRRQLISLLCSPGPLGFRFCYSPHPNNSFAILLVNSSEHALLLTFSFFSPWAFLRRIFFLRCSRSLDCSSSFSSNFFPLFGRFFLGSQVSGKLDLLTLPSWFLVL